MHLVHNQRRSRRPLKGDPSRTGGIRRRFIADLRRRYRVLKRRIFELIVTEDAFGLNRQRAFNEEQSDGRMDNTLLGRGASDSLNGNNSSSGVPRFQGPLNQEQNNDESRRPRKLGRVSSEDTGATAGANRGIIENNFQTCKGSGDLSSVGVLNQRFAFQTTPEQLRLFNEWLSDQIQTEVIGTTIEEVESAYWTQYVRESYNKGAGRAFSDTRRAALAATPEELATFGGSRDEFLRSSFGRAVAPEKVKLLAGRVFTDLKGINQALSTQISRVLTDGLAQGRNPREIARTATDLVDKIGRGRAELMARTEIIRAHAEAQLDTMEELGVTEVGVMVEWSTAGDDRVCPLCQPLEGVILKIEEARGLIPRHPACRCTYIPANVGEPRGEKTLVHFTDPQTGEVVSKRVGQVRGQKGVKRAFDRSIRAEGKRSLAAQKRLSPWQGADTKITKVRPAELARLRRSPRTKEPTKATPIDTLSDINKGHVSSLQGAQKAGQERMLMLEDGRLFDQVDGGAVEVQFTDRMKARLKEGKSRVVTLHNHPSPSVPSPQDLGAFSASGGRHLVIDDDFLYITEFGKAFSVDDAIKLRKDWNSRFITINAKLQQWVGRQKFEGRKVTALTREKKFADLSSEALEKVAKRFGFSYTRVPGGLGAA